MTVAVHRSETATRAMPPWTTVQADVDLVCKLHERLSDVYDVSKLDVVVVGIFHQVETGTIAHRDTGLTSIQFVASLSSLVIALTLRLPPTKSACRGVVRA